MHVYSIHNFICLLMTTIYVDVQTMVQFCTEAATLCRHELQVAQTESAQDFYGAARSCGTPENTDYHSRCLQYNFLFLCHYVLQSGPHQQWKSNVPHPATI